MSTQGIKDICEQNKEMAYADNKDDIDLIFKNWENQFDLVSLYVLVVSKDPYVQTEPFTTMALTSVHKNCISLYSALELTLQGLYGAARIVFRNIYEYLILTKTVAIKADTTLLEKWENGDAISLKRDVFEHVYRPQSAEMKRFWKLLCEYVHGTIYSLQIGLYYDKIDDDVKLNIILLKMLLDMNYHVLNSYATNRSIQYYTKSMSDLHEEGMLKKKKAELRMQISNMRKTLLPEPKRVVLDFASTWELK